MKKYWLSFGLIVAFALYVALSNQGTSNVSGLAVNGSPAAAAPPSPATTSQTPTLITQIPVPAPVPTPTPAPKSAPAPAPVATFKNGTYTGPAADAYYGTVQVAAVIKNGALANVNILQYPSDNGHSREVSSYSLPQLIQEAVASQSANVDIVSGATQTSDAFAQSLAAALAQAKS